MTKDYSLLQTGDILLRLGDARGPFNIPFSKLVAHFTKSAFSHASIVFHQNNEILVCEVNENGCEQLTLEEWKSKCIRGHFTVYRVPEIDQNHIKDIIVKFIEEDPEYDFTFVDPNKFYCTESVVWIYQQLGIELCEPKSAKEVLSGFAYYAIASINSIVGLLTGKKLAMDEKLYFVGNKDMGLLASSKIEKVDDFLII